MADKAGTSGYDWTTASDVIEKYDSAVNLTNIAKKGVASWLFAVGTAGVAGIQSMVDLLLIVPISVLTDIVRSSGEAFVIDPLRVISEGAGASATAAGDFNFLGLPIGVGIVLGTYLLVNRYVSMPETSDILPGVMVDLIPFVGSEDEDDE